MDIIILICIVICLVLLILVFTQISGGKNIDSQIATIVEQNRNTNQQFTSQNESLRQQISTFESNIRTIEENYQKENNSLNEKLVNEMNEYHKTTGEQITEINKIVTEKMQTILDRKLNDAFDIVVKNMNELGKTLSDGQTEQRREISDQLNKIKEEFTDIRKNNQETLDKLRDDNQKSLDKINDTVNEKLQKTLNDRITQSFETVNQRLTEVYTGLGEMKAVANGVTDLKNVLSNVKNRGIMGEIQLSAILNDILAPNQYEEQFKICPDSKELVDFAVRLPGQTEDEFIYLPIDSKFPGDKWAALADAYDNGNADEIKIKRELLVQEIKKCAKSIHDKYIVPPFSTDFAIMFLPFEGLYAEVVNMQLVEQLQRDYHVNITGPSTMAAMLNSLQMGFRTLAIQKKSGEVWKILEAAKAEFNNFATVLDSARKRLRQADDDLEKLIGTRTRAINRKLKDVTSIEKTSDTENLLDLISDED